MSEQDDKSEPDGSWVAVDDFEIKLCKTTPDDKARKAALFAKERAAADYVDNHRANLEDIRANFISTFLDAVAWARANPEWIKCSERMPEDRRKVLLLDDGEYYLGSIVEDYFKGAKKWAVEGYDQTHPLDAYAYWLALPPSPEGE